MSTVAVMSTKRMLTGRKIGVLISAPINVDSIHLAV